MADPDHVRNGRSPQEGVCGPSLTTKQQGSSSLGRSSRTPATHMRYEDRRWTPTTDGHCTNGSTVLPKWPPFAQDRPSHVQHDGYLSYHHSFINLYKKPLATQFKSPTMHMVTCHIPTSWWNVFLLYHERSATHFTPRSLGFPYHLETPVGVSEVHLQHTTCKVIKWSAIQ